jgi:Dolichyl-phosphate-mannose-protein mannosyltransferase
VRVIAATPDSPTRCQASPAISCAHRTASIVVATLALAMLFPVLLLRGMSLDGLTYATIARNLAIGHGSFWHPCFTDTLFSSFHEQPPLALWFESLWFRALGDRWWVERLYSVLTVVPTAVLIGLIWRRMLQYAPNFARLGWLPLLLWILMPSWFWIYRHNYLENTLGIFTALAVYSSLRATEATRWWPAWTALAALAIAGAFGSKGPVGLFPLVCPLVAGLTVRRAGLRHAVLVQMGLVLAVSAIAGVVLLDPEARDYFTTYFHQQILDSLHGQREIVDSALGRFHLAWALMIDLALSAAVAAALVFVAGRRADTSNGAALRGPMAFCFLTALSASLPIMISPKQSAYYAAASWPFYCLGLAVWCAGATESLVARWASRPSFPRTAHWLRLASISTVVLAITLSPLWHGLAFRDGELLDDVGRIGGIVGPYRTIAITPELQEEWSLRAYLYRQHFISLDLRTDSSDYRLESNERAAQAIESELEVTRLSQFRLYKSTKIAARGPNPASGRGAPDRRER